MDSADALMEEKKLMAEAKYRNYMSNIDKALRNFEYSSEWADLISALGKLSKAISGNTQYQVIPRRIKISKRLAQCMHPALPSGVHLKALETYAVIFTKTGPERLATELFIYSAGLFPLLGYAAMNVRPALLGIYETHFVPLGEKLRPALSGFLSGVLPGYETGLDHFERTSCLLKQVCKAVNPTHFYTVLWECVATNAAIRLPAITYLLEHYNKRLGMQEQVYIIGHNREIMMSGLCSCLNDSVILVQRNTLEFLLLGFPMHTTLLGESDLIQLVTNGLNTILRRDMSLNRRLYSWLLGSEVAKNSPSYDTLSLDASSEDVESYFEKHSRFILIQSVINTLRMSLECTPVELKPYRIMLSLLDKADIGSAVLDYVLCDIIRAMSLSSGNLEVIKSANLLFATFDPAYIWSFMTSMYEKSCKTTRTTKTTTAHTSCNVSQNNVEIKYHSEVGSGDPPLIEICQLTEFLLETISLEVYNETTRVYLPKVFLAITQMLTQHQDNLSSEEIIASLKLCMKIVSRVQPMITSPIKLSPRTNQCYSSSDEKCVKSLTKVNNLEHVMAGVSANALEKSKSDSRLNHFAENTINDKVKDEEPMRRANSNQNMERKSPKKKKAKSYSKLSELDKEICISDTGQQSSSDLDTPLSIKKIKSKAKAQFIRTSPKKTRPKDIPLQRDSKAHDQVELKANDDSDGLPKSAPPEQLGKTAVDGVIFDYQEHHDTEDAAKDFSILEKCIRQYEIFFEVYLSRKVLQIDRTTIVDPQKCPIKVQLERENSSNLQVENIFNNEKVLEIESPERTRDIENIFKILRVDIVSRSKLLQNLLYRSMESRSAQNSTSDLDSDSDVGEKQQFSIDVKTKKNVQQLLELNLNGTQRAAIKLASTLLVEMSTFPNCNKNIMLDKSEQEIPGWLKVLCVVACFCQKDREMQMAVITALFDLISLLKSQIEHTTSPGVTFVIMLPLLKFGHVNYIEHKTRIFQLITSTLWDFLGNSEVDPAQVSTLLYQMHSCLDSGLVESVIGNRMFSQQMQQHFATACAPNYTDASAREHNALQNYKYDRASDIHLICATSFHPTQRLPIEQLRESESKSYKKFELLWHLGRDKQSSKGFEKTLLKVLDTLGLPYYMSERTFVTKWLQSALLRGDLSRLIKPLYKILLSTNSKRMGIVHLQALYRDGDDRVNNVDVVDQLDKLNNSFDHEVYAISSEYGNIKYHMESNTSKKRSPIRNFHKKIFGVTLSSKNKTSNFVSDKTPPSVNALEIAEDSTTIGLIINPLENSVDFDDETDFDEPRLECKSSGKRDQTPLEEKLSSAMIEHEEEKTEEPSVHYAQDYTDESESTDFESDSEQRGSSVEKEDSITVSSSTGNVIGATNGGDMKRFVGDCECVTEILSQHERTKNRKTYRLTREKTPGESSLTSATTDDQISLDAAASSSSLPAALSNPSENDSAHPADEYFSEGKQSEVMGESSTQAKGYTKKALKKYPNELKEKRKHKKLLSSSDKKRLSCISKISTDSNQSQSESGVGPSTDVEDRSTHQLFSDDDAQESESQTLSVTTASDSAALTINVEEKRRSLSLETNKLKSDWQLTQQTIEKSKQNLEILRQNAGQNQEDLSIRSSTKSCNSLGEISRKSRNPDLLHLFHNHLLIYLGVYDTKQTLYAFQTLRNIITCDTRTFLCLSITTSFSSGSLKQLLIRHRKSISGKGFNGNISNSEYAHSYRGCMHLELLVTLCLFYARGFFYRDSVDVKNEPATLEDIVSNCRVQLESIELMTLICTELIDIVKGMGKGLASYIADLMLRCKLQKVILHCLNASVNSFGRKFRNNDATFAEQVWSFNDPQDECLHAESFQIQVLRLLMAVIKLEYEVNLLRTETGSVTGAAGGNISKEEASGNVSPTRLSSFTADTAAANVKYLPTCMISQQPMFLAAVLSALQNEGLRHLHRNWTDLITSSLNCFNFGSLTNIVISVVHQLCNNIDRIIKLPIKEHYNLPPDYLLSQLEAITILCHYCLLDNTQQTSLSHLFNQVYPQTSVSSQNSNTGQLLNSIVHSFLSSTANTVQNEAQSARNPQLQAARNAVLSHLPRIVASVASVWDSEMGQVRQIKQQLMEFLSPVSLHHGCNFLTAVAVTWQERGEAHRRRLASESHALNLSPSEQFQRNSTLHACAEQLSLVTLVSSIRVMPTDSFVQTLHQVVRSPPPIHRPPAYLSVEVSALELFYFYMKSAAVPQLGDSWSSLHLLLRDGMNLSPPAQFTLLMLLNEFVQRCPQMPFQDKKDIRDLHDDTSRLVDSLSNVAGACLEQTTWLRRNLAVKEDNGGNSRDSSMGGIQQYSLQAQSVLAAILSNLLDVAYGSQEKDKVVTIVTTLLYNITPYLKNHTARNVPSFYACSALLASISGFQYTRKAWRKDMLDLMLDSAFFQMDISCLPFWRQIMDSLMTYDNTTFRELMSRVSLTQAGTLNIFASREQEYEQRAMLLKRLAFVIYCSEFDQYNKYMPEIQEQLTNSLRLLSMVPAVQSAVFLCFRVLLLRMSADHVTSLWPIIIAEMVQVFLAMEQELKSDGDDLSQQMRLLSGIVEWSSSSSSNGLNSHSHVQHWRSVQLEASKLLEVGCVLPATNLPHFQMYRWAFVGTEFDAHEDVLISNGNIEENIAILSNTVYVPHVRRIARLMDMKFTNHTPSIEAKRDKHLMLSFQQIHSLQELYDFFSTLSISCPNPYRYAESDKDVKSCLQEIEDVLSKDFLERMQSSTTPR